MEAGHEVGATAGNIVGTQGIALAVGNDLSVTTDSHSDIVTGRDLTLQGSAVTVDDARYRYRYSDITNTNTEHKGLTLAVTGRAER